jgi:hypothetical protein
VTGSVTVDNTAPVVTVTAPANNSFTNNTTPTFSGACVTADGNVTVTVKQSGSTVQTRTTACSAATYSVATSPALAENTYTAQSSQTDAALNTGTSSTNTFTVDTTTPTVSSVTLVNGGSAAGKVEKGDQIVIVFSEQMKVNSFCSAWTSGDSSDQSINGNNQVTVTLTDGGASSDSISVSSSTCTFNFGSIGLGNVGYVTGGNATFSGTSGNKSTIAWTASTRTLTITLGAKGGSGTIPAAAVSSSTATYTPSSSVADSAGNAGIAAKSTGNVQQF